MRVHVHVPHEIATAVRVVILTARATAKVHFVRELAQSLGLLKMNNAQRRGKEQDHLLQGGVKGKMTGIKKMTKSMIRKEAKVAPDPPEKGSGNHHLSPVLDLDLEENVVDQDQEALPQDEGVEDDTLIVAMMKMGIVYMLQTLM